MSNAEVWKRYKAQSDAIDLVLHPEYQAVFKAAMEAADALRRCILHDHSQSAWAQPAFEAVLDTIRLAHPAADAPPSEPWPKPVRVDLAVGALHVALKTDDADVRYGFTQSALDFLTGDYEDLDQ